VAPARVKPAGTINVGLKELGAFGGHPKLAINPALFVVQSAPVPEGLLFFDLNREIKGWLAESWSISPDFLTWTFKLRKGVQFHKGYGEMTAEDVAWSSTEGWAKNEKLGRFPDVKEFWAAPGGRVETPDRYTVAVNTGKPLSDAGVLEIWLLSPSAGGGTWVASKKQSEKEGTEAANANPALTGSWEIVEHRPQQFWKMRAVENHWRQTPYFAELVFWEVPEESARIAGFQTGNLDTFSMAFDTIPLVEKVKGARFIGISGSADSGLHLYGNYLVEALAGKKVAAYDPQLPWVSSNPDLASPEWVKARKVRQALSIAIDRQTIVDTVLRGFARPIAVKYWSNLESQLAGRRWEYNPDKAKQLLAEAGYPKGFKITLTTAIRGSAGEVEACEVIATMWGNIGIDVKFQKIPYDTLRPQIVARTYQGATCHSAGARVLSPGIANLITSQGSFNFGASHPFIEEITPRIEGAVDRKELNRLTADLGAFLFDNALTAIGLYSQDVVWPVGARLEEWKDHVKTRDTRNINGFEFIRPRK
jgi:peptide/nickel transport system substrate-binding protein